ncbi:MAG: hypothetical protein OEW15_18105, partial [Nitrospirota bacterium]|nr:hypothetical protein [Nitrospirota bacterium]
MTAIKRKVIFRSPQQTDILIFERTGSNRIKKYILQDLPAHVLDSQVEELFIGIRIFLYFFLFLRYLNFSDSSELWQMPRSIARQIRRIYLLSCIKCFRPKVVVTWIDNYPMFHWLCDHYQDAEFIAIQNGSRTRVEFRGLTTPYRINHFFCFGNYERDLYAEFGHRIDNYYPVGSVLGGYYRYVTAINRSVSDKQKYDICIVSCWRGNIGNGPDVQMTMKAMHKMDSLLARYIRVNNLTACIALRSEPVSADRIIPVYGDEKEYFQSIYPEQVVCIDPDFKERNIYPIMDDSSLIVSIASTALREAFGWGKKALYFDFTGTILYNDFDPAIVCRDDDYELLKHRLDDLRRMPLEVYRASTRSYASYIMNYQETYPPH